MINVNQITSQLAKMPDPLLQKFAAMHKNDPYTVALALAESNRRKDLRQAAQAKMVGQAMPKVVDQEVAQIAAPQALPEEVGIGQLPAPNMQKFAGGGIVAFEEGGEVDRYQDKGLTESVPNPFKGASRDLTELVLATAAKYGIDPNIAMRLVKQESGFDPKAVSKRGAAGLTQLMPAAAKDMGLSPEERFDPVKNVNAGFGYLKKQLDKYGGDYAKALSAYNWGGGNLDKHLTENKGNLNKIGLPKETADYLTKILPMGAAAAATPESGDIPKPAAKESAPTAPQTRSQFQAIADAAKNIVGAGETGLQFATGLAAIPTAGGAAMLEQLPNVLTGKGADRAAMEKSFREKAGQVTYQPRTAAGENIAEGTARFLSDDLKLPPYLAHMGNLPVRKGTPSIKADLAELAAERTRQAETPRLAGPSTDATMIQGRNQAPVQQGRAVANQMADIQDAAAWRAAAEKAGPGTASTLPETLARNAELRRAQNVAAASSPAIAAAAAAPGLSGLAQGFVPGQGLPADFGADLGKEPVTDTKGGIEDLKKALPETAAAAAKPGFSSKDEMMLQFFLGLMGGESPNFATNVGKAGLGALKYGMEAKKEESERAYREALAKHHTAASKYAGMPAEVQLLEYLKDPKNMEAYQRQREAMGDPAMMKSLVTEYIKNPAGMQVLEKTDPALFAIIKQQAKQYLAPNPLSTLPGAGATTRPPV